jgi:phosphoglycerol transferase MdoB-like AlkP superfamily enzyme
MKLRFSRSARRSLLLICALALFIFAVCATAWSEPTLRDRGFVLALMICTCGALLFAMARPAVALLLGSTLFLLLKFTSEMKLQYLESPLMPSDFVYFARTSLVETLDQYPNLLRIGVAACIVVPLVLLLAWWMDYRLFPRMRGSLRTVVRVAGTAACVAGFWACLLPHGPFASVYHKGLWEMLSGRAHLTNFFTNLHDSEVQMPAMASTAAAEQNWAATAAPTGAVDGTPKFFPDIVQVLEESTFDPSILTGCNIPQCDAQMFQPNEQTRGHGLLRTHTFGGGTWVSEFSVLTGMPQDIFGPAGMYAPYVLAPRTHDTLPMQLNRLGYLTIAIYPVGGNFLNARNAYRAYGFDQFYAIHDLGLVMWHSSDAQLFAAAKRVYDKVRKPGQPVFLMILTMEQHGPHDSQPLSSLPAPYNQGLLRELPADQALNLGTYLSRLYDSDQGMSQLEHDFLDRPEPTLIVHFGDHQPAFGGLTSTMARTLSPDVQRFKDYLTYYMIKSNFAGPPLPDYPALDIAYLPSMVLQAAGLPEDPYFSALSSLRTRCNGLYADCSDTSLVASYYTWIFDRLHEFQ